MSLSLVFSSHMNERNLRETDAVLYNGETIVATGHVIQNPKERDSRFLGQKWAIRRLAETLPKSERKPIWNIFADKNSQFRAVFSGK